MSADEKPPRLLRSDADAHVKGLALIRRLHGGHSGEQLVASLEDICPDFVTMTIEWAAEQRGLVRRTVYAEMPPRVEYEVTSLGATLRETLDSLAAWMRAHGSRLSRSREALTDARRR